MYSHSFTPSRKNRCMQTFTIFRHPAGTTVALKAGWNWFAFFFSVAWLAHKQLWSRALGSAAAIAVALFLWTSTVSLDVALQHSTHTNIYTSLLLVFLNIITWVAAIGTLVWVLVYVPYKAHKWRTQHLVRSGYVLVDTVQAYNSEGAHAVWLMQREAVQAAQ